MRKKKKLTGTLTSPSIPFDLIPEILYRLSVKLLMQFRCVCKPWNSLISDPKFAKKHLLQSTTLRINTFSYSEQLRGLVIKSYTFDSVFTNITTNNVTKLEFPREFYYFVGSCNGILCFADIFKGFVFLWNPSIRKFKELPSIEKPEIVWDIMMMYGFGYDSVTDNYKVVVVLRQLDYSGNFDKTDVMVHTSSTNCWKSIQELPFRCTALQILGKFVSGRMNWLASKDYVGNGQCFIVSFDLGNESFQEVLLPDYGEEDAFTLYLGVLKDCLCVICGHYVWLMKEYGNKESWTKLFTISHMKDPSMFYASTKAVYIFEDDQVLLKTIGGRAKKLILYNSRNGTFKFSEFENTPQVCVESLISPYF